MPDPGAVPGVSTKTVPFVERNAWERNRIDARSKDVTFSRHCSTVIGLHHRCQRQRLRRRGPRCLKIGKRGSGGTGQQKPPTLSHGALALPTTGCQSTSCLRLRAGTPWISVAWIRAVGQHPECSCATNRKTNQREGDRYSRASSRVSLQPPLFWHPRPYAHSNPHTARARMAQC